MNRRGGSAQCRLRLRTAWLAAVVAVAVLAGPVASFAQGAPESGKVIAAARELMAAQQYCALITVDESGRPQIRTMNPFPPDEDMVVWMATNTRSRKVAEIKKDPRVTLYYADHAKATGYVAITGRAALVDDTKEVLARKRAYWDQAFPGLKNIVLIKVVPERIDVVNYKHGLTGEPTTWRSPSIPVSADGGKK